MEKISKLQIVDQKYWGGLTREAHLGWLGMNEPQYISQVVDKLYELNYGTDNLVSFMEQFPTHYLDEAGVYRWRLQGSEERNIPLVSASDTSGSSFSAGDKPGLARSEFFMVFPERYFSATSVIVGEHPDAYSLRVVEDPLETATGWRYRVQLITGDDSLFVPLSDIQAGKRWSEEYGQVEHEFSKRGNEVKHASPLMMENVTSMIRKNYDVPGNMLNKGKNAPLAFAFIDENGKTQTRWIDKLGWDFMRQFRWDKARLLLYGKSNKMNDGQYGNKGESGNTIRSGFGLYEQMDGGNIKFFNKFHLDNLTKFALDISVGKLREDSRKFVLSTGEYGAYDFHVAASEKASGFQWLQSGHNFKVGDGKVTLDEGQIMKYVAVNGIEFNIIIDPMKDDPVRNKVLHPEGGFANSRTYDIFDFGTTNGQPNIQRVAVKGDEEHFRYVPGMRDPFTPDGKGSSPVMTASPVDGYSVYKMYTGGVLLRNPLKTGRMIPTMLQ